MRIATAEIRRDCLALVLCCFLPALWSCSSRQEGLEVYPKAVGAADEGSTIQTLRTIATAENQMKATRGVYGNFEALTQAGFLDERFASSEPNLKGYRFTINASDSEYSVNADPHTTANQPTTGSRHFFLDSDGTIHVNAAGSASRSDPQL